MDTERFIHPLLLLTPYSATTTYCIILDSLDYQSFRFQQQWTQLITPIEDLLKWTDSSLSPVYKENSSILFTLSSTLGFLHHMKGTIERHSILPPPIHSESSSLYQFLISMSWTLHVNASPLSPNDSPLLIWNRCDCSTRVEAISIPRYDVHWFSIPLTPSLGSWQVWVHSISIFTGSRMCIAGVVWRHICIDTLLPNYFKCINRFHVTIISSTCTTQTSHRIQKWTDFPQSFGEEGWEDNNKGHMLPVETTRKDTSEAVPNLINVDFNTRIVEPTEIRLSNSLTPAQELKATIPENKKREGTRNENNRSYESVFPQFNSVTHSLTVSVSSLHHVSFVQIVTIRFTGIIVT